MAQPLPVFGVTCPLLNVAKHYGVPYEMTLLIADSMQHGREIPDERAEMLGQLPFGLRRKVRDDVRYVCDYMEDLRSGAVAMP